MLEAPGLLLRPEMIACARHLEPFRARWPEGFAALTLLAIRFIQGRDPTPNAEELQATIDADEIDPATTEFWQVDMAGTDAEGMSDRMLKVLTARPICERVPRAELEAMYAGSTIARLGDCRVCLEEKLGAPYSLRGPEPGQITLWPHVCFDCVLDRLQETR